ncbi:MAG: hypothetical protein L0I33_10960, partial [Acetobacter sp.]|nr:hypothetical protein [Acetobacter sp.]
MQVAKADESMMQGNAPPASAAITVVPQATLAHSPSKQEAQPSPTSGTTSAKQVATPERINVVGHLNKERARIFPGLGAVDYRIDQRQISTTPGGQNAAFNQILLRVPGVVLDSYGEVHVRGEHGGLTYRVNGVLLPEGLNGFGQELDTRIIQSVDLLT